MSSQLCQLPDISPPVGVHTRVHSQSTAQESCSTWAQCRGRDQDKPDERSSYCSLAGPVHLHHSAVVNLNLKKPSKIKVPKRADAQKSSGDLSGVQTQRFSRGDDDQRSKCHHPGASPSWFSTDLLFDLGQVPCLLCQYFPSCPQEQNPYLIWCVKISAFRSLEIR